MTYNTYTTYTSDGSTTDFVVPFSYDDPGEVRAFVGTDDVEFTFVNPGLIRLATAPNNGTVVTVRRYTDLSSPIVTFINNKNVLGGPANSQVKQLLKGLQEIADTQSDQGLQGLQGPPGPTGASGPAAGFVLFETRAAVALAMIPGVVDEGPAYLRTAGYSAVGDRGGGLYKRVNVEPPHPGKIQSLDGSWWELVAERDEVWVEQFGAERIATINATTPDSWQAFEDAKDYIVAKRGLLYGGGYTLRIGVGAFYLSKAHEMKGATYHIQGMGTGITGVYPTILRFPAGSDGIIIQRANTTDRDASVWVASTGYNVGERRYNGGNLYVAKTTGIAAASGGPTGTGTGIVDGTVTWDFVRTLRTNETAVAIGADGAQISNLALYSHWWQSGSPYTNHSGVIMRARARVTGVAVVGFAGCGVAVVANGDPDFPGTLGNANSWYVGHSTMYLNGMDGLHIGFADANAGMSEMIDVSYNGRWGIAEFSFLGNTHIQPHAAYNGWYAGPLSVSQHPKVVTHNGYRWLAKVECLGVDVGVDYSNEPGTSQVSWVLRDGDGTLTPTAEAPAWSSSVTYEPGGDYASNNINSRNTWIGVYAEGGGSAYSQLWGRDYVMGGDAQYGGVMPTGTSLWMQNGRMNNQIITRGYTVTTDGVKIVDVRLGPIDNPYANTNLSKDILGWTDYDGNALDLRGIGDANVDYILQSNQVRTELLITGANTLKSYGRPAAIPGAVVIPRLIVGEATSGGRMLTAASAAPTTGAWAQGDVVLNTGAVAGGSVGWVCVEAGTPGTWKTFGTIAA